MPSLSENEKIQLAAKAYADPVYFCRTFLRDLFSRPVPWVHRGLLAILTRRTKFLLNYGELDKIVKNFVQVDRDSGEVRRLFKVLKHGVELETKSIEDIGRNVPPCLAGVEIKLDLGQYTLVLMPRGSSKTTIAGLAVPLIKILFQDDIFTLYVSKADKHAEAQLESIKYQLGNNELIREVFGELRPQRSDDERWAASKFETATGVAMASKGKGGQIRGVNHRNKRPTTIIVDDPQDRKDVMSDTMRESDIKWAFAELTPARAQLAGEEGTIVALGTKIHRKCLVNVWAEDPQWTVVELGVFDTDGDPIWADYMNRKKYEAEKESFRRQGLLSLFYMEYDNQVVTTEDQMFPHEYWIIEPPDEVLICATYCDPAMSEKRTADFTAIVTCGINAKGIIWVMDVWMKRTSDEREKAIEFFRQVRSHNSQFMGFESNGYQAALGNTIKEQMFREKIYFELQAVAHKTKKVQRIRGALKGRYASGYMRHARQFPEFESQMEDFRMDDSHEHDDGPDAVAACVGLLDPAAALAGGQDITRDIYDDDQDFEEWRTCA